MMNWTPARDRDKYGVAIYNFSGINVACIKLNVGETVHILEELGEWYFGYALHNKSLRGVFPKSYIQVKDCIVDKTGLVEVVTPRLPPIVQEVTAVLREWGVLLRKLYVEQDKNFSLLRDTMKEIIAHRSKILSGQLPGDELKQLKHRITHGIDRVNERLGLDLVVRDDHGNILNPDITSAVKLFRHHDEAAARLRKLEESDGRIPTVRRKPHLSWTALLSFTNIIIKVPESSEISLGLYVGDAKEGKEKPLTEEFIIPWAEEGYNGHPDLLLNLKCLFTDLSTITLDESQLWLIGYVVRQGSMATKEVDPKRTSALLTKRVTSTDCMRRPFGIVMLEMTSYFQKMKLLALDGNDAKEKDCCATFYPCGDKETLDMKKLLSSRNESIKDNKTNSQGIWFSFELINGDLKQLREDNPHYVSLRDVPVALRLGLSDVIMPGDVRNDLYVTLISGEFSRGAKTSDRNVEVTIRIVNEKGRVIPGVIHQGCGKVPLDEYRSVTYHHENKPKWMETVKIALPIEEFKKAHIKFTFKHRSTNDVKDKSEKPFSMSFVKLMQENGTTLFNTEHDLIIYKIDPKKWQDDDISYLKLSWRRVNGEELNKVWNYGLAPSSKDNFTISTTFCSTKLTQNAELLGLLEWGWSGSTDTRVLQQRLEGLRRVPAEELMVFLQDTLDVLLEILMNNSTSDDSDNRVFEALVYVITIATDKNKHEAFQPVLDSYIQQNFHATLAYNKLIHVLKFYVEQGMDMDRQETLKKSMKCLQYIFKFIIRSRQLFVELHGRGQEEFEKSLQQLLEAMAHMMVHTNDSTLTVQAHCLKYITTTIPDIMSNFDPVTMSAILVKMIDNLDHKRIPKQKLMTMNDIIHSELFKIPDCRAVLLPCFITHIKRLLAANEEVTDFEVVMRKEKKKTKLEKLLGTEHCNTHVADDRSMTEELELCVKILGDILDVLFCADVGSTFDDMTLLSSKMLENILTIVYKMTRDDPLICKFVSVLVSLLRQMNEKHFVSFLNRFSTQEQLFQFLVELQMVIQDLIVQPVFPADWAEMILLQNSVILKVLHQLSRVISDKMREPFKEFVWCNFFLCAIKFLTQPSLQLEKFTQSKRTKILSRYRDMRRETAAEIRSLWFSLGQHKIRFVAPSGSGQSMVGPFLEMTMIPEVELRKATIPIFFDMMQCEFYSLRDQGNNVPPDMARNNQKNKGKFNKFENEILEKLDHLVEGGHGDDHYREVFQTTVGALCEDHATMREPGLRLVNTVSRLMDRLLQYRTIMNTPDNSAETRMSCTVNLLEFYSEINRKELYLRYVYKLQDLHLGCDNYTEAGYTLLQHANLLRWSPDSLSHALRSPLFHSVTQHDELKEKLYERIITYFDKGQMWEDALKLCKELVQHYEEVILNYTKLGDLLKRMAQFYENIMNPQNLRPEPEYFRVAYYGRGFPAFLQNKVFVYRGNGYERLGDFTSRILDQFPNAELMKKLTPPSDDVKESPQQFIQISKVDCVMHENPFPNANVSEQIERYYRANQVKVFTYSRPFHRGQKDPTNEFATLCIEKTTLYTLYSLPGILRCFPVVKTKSKELSPLENALETMTNVNEEVHELVKKYSRDSALPLDPLTRKLSGMVDPAVMGGIANYEKAFLGDDYIQSHQGDSEKVADLRLLIASQVPLLEAGLCIHATRVTDPISGLHDHMVASFTKMKAQVQEKYGVQPMPADLRIDVRPLKLHSQISVGSDTSQRASHQYDSLEMDSVELRSPREEPKSDNLRHSFSRSLQAISERSSEFMFINRLSPAKSKGGTLPRNHKSSLPDHGLSGSSGSKSTKKEKSISKLLRRESFTSTQWFDRPDSQVLAQPPPQPIIELSEQVNPFMGTSSNQKSKSRLDLATERPLRSDVERERRMSRPRSFNLNTPSVSTTPSPSMGSRESLSTPTESLHEEEAPPPLPVKMREREQDADGNSLRYSGLSIKSGKMLPPVPSDISPEPPEKPPRPDRNHNHEDSFLP